MAKKQTIKKSEKNNKQLDDLVNLIELESEKLKGKGELDGLHNLVSQNVYLSKIYVELTRSINKLEKSTTFYSKWLVGLTIILTLLTIILLFKK